MKNTASFSRCRRYRYALWRTWDESRPRVLFIGLNPSTADEWNDDPTLRRCIAYAKTWGYGGVCMANLFALRATDPAAMKADPDPVGPRNNRWLKKLAGEAALVVAAWGNDGSHRDRAREILGMISDVHCLKLNKSGEPAHPLYQPAYRRPVPLRA